MSRSAIEGEESKSGFRRLRAGMARSSRSDSSDYTRILGFNDARLIKYSTSSKSNKSSESRRLSLTKASTDVLHALSSKKVGIEEGYKRVSSEYPLV